MNYITNFNLVLFIALVRPPLALVAPPPSACKKLYGHPTNLGIQTSAVFKSIMSDERVNIAFIWTVVADKVDAALASTSG